MTFIILKREFAPEFLGSIYHPVLSIIGDEDGSLPREKLGREIFNRHSEFKGIRKSSLKGINYVIHSKRDANLRPQETTILRNYHKM